MIRLPDVESPLDARTFLVSFCALAMEIYPDLDWNTVAPKLQRSWDRAHGEHGFRWAEVCESARMRWEARVRPDSPAVDP